mgnify:FL=1
MIGDIFRKLVNSSAENLSILEIEERVKVAKNLEVISFTKSDSGLVPVRGNVFDYKKMTTCEINDALDEYIFIEC